MNATASNHDPAEIARFDDIAQRWWDPKGEFRPLHVLNPVRLDYVDEGASLRGKRVLDVGCGGGILSEAMAKRGAQVTGIDLAPQTIEVAGLHTCASRPRRTRLIRRALTTSSPAWKCSNTCPSRKACCALCTIW
jgi:2-polyprenyl-6-hydroxyphenyl methylase/3-demethylubiquinone-9 3-methyltransferase